MIVPEHFDAVVVGSGFGGSVMAYRLAAAGLNVCLLERGKAYGPGAFARTPRQMRRNIWDPSRGYYGLFNTWSFDGMESIVSSGLGGGSLIYANVLLRKDENWFVRQDPTLPAGEHWPITRAELDPHYSRVEAILQPQLFPAEGEPYSQVAKVQAFRAAAEASGHSWQPVPLGIVFANRDEAPQPNAPIIEPLPNYHGASRTTCHLCGECDIGCNHGSKNSLDYTYLSIAKRLGADIRTLCEVRTFAPRPNGGYTINYVQHENDPALEGQPRATHDPQVLPIRTITADRLILSAGTFGTTYLLLRCRKDFPNISPMLGQRFCGNGDLITFAARCHTNDCETDQHRFIDASHGPVITSAVRVGDREDGEVGRGFYIQDAGYPDAVAWMLQMLDAPRMAWRAHKIGLRLLHGLITNRSLGDVGSDLLELLLGDADRSAGMLPLLGIGRDVPDGWMEVKSNKRGRDRLVVHWKPKRSGPYFRQVRKTMQALADKLGARKVVDPLRLFRRTITVHPLGGCPMGETIEQGVVNTQGEVFNYPGLYIADGSVMPGPVGVNPALTIAALANKFADGIIATRKRPTRRF